MYFEIVQENIFDIQPVVFYIIGVEKLYNRHISFFIFKKYQHDSTEKS